MFFLFPHPLHIHNHILIVTWIHFWEFHIHILSLWPLSRRKIFTMHRKTFFCHPTLVVFSAVCVPVVDIYLHHLPWWPPLSGQEMRVIFLSGHQDSSINLASVLTFCRFIQKTQKKLAGISSLIIKYSAWKHQWALHYKFITEALTSISTHHWIM